MSLKVEIRDFQSIKKGEFEFENGINILNGKTNSGKSAVLRAIDSALFNIGDDSMVRVGSRYAAVLIDNGNHRLIFRRDSVGKNEKTAYSFDGAKAITKVGRSQLPEVAEMFGIRDVRMQNGTKMKLNFWYQNDKPFLTDKTAGQLYEFLSLSSCDKYSRVLKSIGADIKILSAEVANRGIEIDTLKVVTGKKEDFVRANAGYKELYEKIIIFDKMCKDNEALKELLNSVIRMMREVKKLKEELGGVKQTLSNPIMSSEGNMNALKEEFNEISGIKRSITKGYEDRNKLCVWKNSISNVKKQQESASKLLEKGSLLESVSRFFEGKGKCDVVITMLKNIEHQKTALRKLKLLEVPDGVEELFDIIKKSNNVGKMVSTVEDLLKKLETLKNDLSDVNKSLNDNDKELEMLKNDVGYCPYCNTVFGGSHCD